MPKNDEDEPSFDEQEEELEEQTQEEDDEEEDSAQTTTPKKRSGRPKPSVFNADNDDVCLAIRAFFEQHTEENTPIVISRNTTILAEDDTEIAVGKMLYCLRMRYRMPKHTPLVKSRLDALKDLKELQTFLDTAPMTKQRSSGSSAQLVSIIREKLHTIQANTLQVEFEQAKCMLDVAKQELEIFECRKKQKH